MKIMQWNNKISSNSYGGKKPGGAWKRTTSKTLILHMLVAVAVAANIGCNSVSDIYKDTFSQQDSNNKYKANTEVSSVISVPTVTGKTYEEAEKILNEQNLKIEKKGEVHSGAVDKEKIISQYPFAIETVDLGTIIVIITSKGPNPQQDANNKNKEYKKTINKIKVLNKKIALTFDDGFNRKYIEIALSFLKKANIKSTFFIPGKILSLYPDLWNQAMKDGHQICNHTQGHFTLTQFKDDNRIIKEICEWESTAQRVLGKEYLKIMKDNFPYLRLPGGAGSNDKRILQLVANEGYIPIGWSKDTYSDVQKKHKITKDNEDYISSLVSDYIINNAEKGDIILQHFIYADISQLDKTILGLSTKGFSIVQISDLLADADETIIAK